MRKFIRMISLAGCPFHFSSLDLSLSQLFDDKSTPTHLLLELFIRIIVTLQKIPRQMLEAG